jgi:hypothetical protein
MNGTDDSPATCLWQEIAALVSADIRTGFFIGILIIYILCLLDILTTTLAISLGGYEMNPVMGPVAGIPVLHLLVKWIALLLILVIASWCEKQVARSGYLILATVIGWYLFVIAHNVTILSGLIARSG